jgi:GGDEF domain-containing protein
VSADRPKPAVETTPAVAALVAVLVAIVAAVEFSVPSSQQLGITTLYLWPIVIGALWFGPRVAVGIVAAVMLLQAAWYASIPHGLSAGGGVLAIGIRGTTYLVIACLVGEFAARLRRTALTDPLTRLPNRRAFFDEIRRRSHVAARLGIVIADVDGLKQINDRDGHDAGDEAIVRTGRALERLLGDGGFVCRFGGDEFVAITTPELSHRIGLTPDPLAGAQVGTAVYSTTDGSRIDDVLADADQSLYRAKARTLEEPSDAPTSRAA